MTGAPSLANAATGKVIMMVLLLAASTAWAMGRLGVGDHVVIVIAKMDLVATHLPMDTAFVQFLVGRKPTSQGGLGDGRVPEEHLAELALGILSVVLLLDLVHDEDAFFSTWHLGNHFS